MERITIGVIFFLLSISAYAEPSVSSVFGTLEHDGTITISGSDFGSKSPAAPRVWDACDDSSTNDLDTFYTGQRYPALCSGIPGVDPYLMDYRQVFHGFDEKPNNRITKFISGAATTCDGDWDNPGLSPRANNVITVENWDSLMVFAMFWHRIDPRFSQNTATDGDNYKEFSGNGQDGSYLSSVNGGSQSYIGACLSPYNGYNDGDHGTDYNWGTNGGSCSSSDRVYMPNPMVDWVHYEFEYDTTGRHVSLSTGSRVETTHGEPIWSHRDFDNCINGIGTVPSVSLGGFIRTPRASQEGNYRYWAGIYLDDTYSRVMLGNNPNWDDCTMREPQIPSAWSGSSITATMNLGGLTDDVYLFVFDADNNHNVVGYPVALAQSSECGNSNCDANECNTCPQDCSIDDCCEDGICQIPVGENCTTCPEDCGNCAVECIHNADQEPCDGLVSTEELAAYISEWKAGAVSIQNVMGAIVVWKG